MPLIRGNFIKMNDKGCEDMEYSQRAWTCTSSFREVLLLVIRKQVNTTNWLGSCRCHSQRWAFRRARKREKVQPALIYCRQNHLKIIRHNKVLWHRVWEQRGWEYLTGRTEMGEVWKGTKLWEVKKSDYLHCNWKSTYRNSKGKGTDCVSSLASWAAKYDGRTAYMGQSQGEADGAIHPMSLRVMVCQEFWRVGRMEWILKLRAWH